MDYPEPGDFAVVRTSGLPAAVIRWVTRSPVNHAVLSVGRGWIVEGDPHGALLSRWDKYPQAIWADWQLTVTERKHVASWGRAHVGTPYSWLDDLEIGLVKLFGWAPKWIRRRLRSTKTLMCSQLVDAAYQAAGIDLFVDGRPTGSVSPGDLYDLILRSRA